MPEFYMILARKIIKIPEFLIFARKINKIPEFYTIFARKMPEFYIIIARKIFFPIFFWGGGTCPLMPPSPTPMALHSIAWRCILLYCTVLDCSLLIQGTRHVSARRMGDGTLTRQLIVPGLITPSVSAQHRLRDLPSFILYSW